MRIELNCRECGDSSFTIVREMEECCHAAGAGSARAAATTVLQPLEYQLVDLLKMEGIGEQESQAIWTLVRFLSTRT
jgi:hypothetical protein